MMGVLAELDCKDNDAECTEFRAVDSEAEKKSKMSKRRSLLYCFYNSAAALFIIFALMAAKYYGVSAADYDESCAAASSANSEFNSGGGGGRDGGAFCSACSVAADINREFFKIVKAYESFVFWLLWIYAFYYMYSMLQFNRKMCNDIMLIEKRYNALVAFINSTAESLNSGESSGDGEKDLQASGIENDMAAKNEFINELDDAAPANVAQDSPQPREPQQQQATDEINGEAESLLE